MAAVEALVRVEGHPCVVVDRVEMQFKVPSTEALAADVQKRGLARRLRRRPHTVTVRALNELSLVVERGESVGIIGRNGSGKSTLMKLISGQLRATSGSVLASSTPVMLGVNAALVPDLSGDQNVVLGCLAMGLARPEIDSRFDKIVELSGLEKAIYLPMKSYSSGMSSRLRFAIAASLDPEILLVDEALNTGDAQFSDRSKQRMDELRAQAGCVLLVSHSLGTITDMCTRTLWLDKGDLIMDGDPEEAVKAYKDFTSHLSKGNNISAAKIRSEARANLVATEIRERTSGRRKGGL
ncbi:ABC transporter ATP-binding protein [Arthrobacter sp. A5]|uniref:ABC transporter ATP-binding protein n=1 Tax=Arthrobacter sp. A5 TaxID=576926 RepID=UPI003DAA2D3B